MLSCIFCKIAKKEIPAKTVYEDKDTIAFWDIKPKVPIHILLIPKKHIVAARLNKKDGAIIGKLILIAQRVAKKLKADKNGYRKRHTASDMTHPASYRLVINVGKDAGQTIEHLHIHLLAGKKLPWA